MRIRAVVAVVVLLVPTVSSGLSAQRARTPRIGARGPARPADLPPQAPAITRELSYTRLNIAFESYPLVTYAVFPGFGDGVVSRATTFGMGTRADYRLTRYLSATLDMTSSMVGGPAVTETAELGTRLGPQHSERAVNPFVDVRVGYMFAYNRNFRPFEDLYGSPPPTAQQYGYVGQYSHGFGGVGGAGVEFALTRTLSLTTAASAMRTRMSVAGFQAFQPAHQRYWMTTYRYALGVRYNPVRFLTD